VVQLVEEKLPNVAKAWIEVAALYHHHSGELILRDLDVSHSGSSLQSNKNEATASIIINSNTLRRTGLERVRYKVLVKKKILLQWRLCRVNNL
jgi:hypothetical protein